jgi:hypothetical protein
MEFPNTELKRTCSMKFPKTELKIKRELLHEVPQK